MVHVVWGQKDQPSGRDRNPVQNSKFFGTEFPHYRQPRPNQGLFHPKTWQEDFLYDTISSWVLKSRFGEGWLSTFLAPFCWFSSREMGQNGVPGQLLLRFAPFLLQWYLFIKKHHWNKHDRDWCSRWWVLADWQWNVGFTPREIGHVPPSWQHSRCYW